MTMVKCKTEHLKYKEGLIVKHREVDISRIRSAVKLTQSTWTLVSNHKPGMQFDQNGHWSHLSDLPSKGAPSGHTTICDNVT